MKFTPTLWLAGALLSLVGCQGSEAEIPLTHTGDEAEKETISWIASLPATLEYPAQSHMEMGYKMKFYDAGEDMVFDFALDCNALSKTSRELLVWGDLEFDVPGPEGHVSDAVSFELRTDGDGLFFRVEDDGILEEQFGMDLPKVFTLSPENASDFGKVFLGYMNEMQAMQGEEFAESQYQLGLDGAGALLHPAAWTRYLPLAQGIDILGWGALGDRVRIQLGIAIDGLAGSIDPVNSPFDFQKLDGQIVEATFDRRSGSVLSYSADIEFPLDGEMGGYDLKADFEMSILLEEVPASKNPLSDYTPTEEETLNLDDYYEQFLPLFRVVMDMQMQQMRVVLGEKNAEDDFSF